MPFTKNYYGTGGGKKSVIGGKSKGGRDGPRRKGRDIWEVEFPGKTMFQERLN